MEPGNLKITPVKNELKTRLYLRQIRNGSDLNQILVVNKDDYGFGTLAVNDWSLYDGLGSGAKLVARGQGSQLKADKVKNDRWFNAFDLVFVDDRFKGSTLQVRGGSVADDTHQWSIVGGTGEFTLAQGIISKKKVQEANNTSIFEVNVRAFYTPLPQPT